MFPFKTNLQLEQKHYSNSILIGLCVFVYLIFASSGLSRTNIFSTFGLFPQRFLNNFILDPFSLPNYIPFLTSIFLHTGLAHITLNLWMLYLFGPPVEESMGSVRYLIFFVLCSILGSLVQIWVSPDLNNPLAGASGAIAGVMGGFLFTYPRSKTIFLLPLMLVFFVVELPTVYFLITWFFGQLYKGLINFFMETITGQIYFKEHVAWWVHIGGFTVGVLLTPILRKRGWRKNFENEHLKKE